MTDFMKLVATIIQIAKEGKTTILHCRGGKG